MVVPVQGAVFEFTAGNELLDDGRCKALMAAPDLAQEAAAILPPISICSDVTAIASPGVITRTVIVAFSADFVQACPTLAQQTAMMVGLFQGMLGAQTPAKLSKITLTVGVVSCP